MITVVQYADLLPSVLAALRSLKGTGAGQKVIKVGDDACEVDWSTDVHYHRSLRLPLILLTAVLDKEAAKARWHDISFVQSLADASELDLSQKYILLGLAGGGVVNPSFADELVGWIDLFKLGRDLVRVNIERVSTDPLNGHYGVRPVALETGDFKAFKAADETTQLATLAVMGLYNSLDTLEQIKKKRLVRLNPSAVEGFTSIREAGGDEAFGRLLRMIAAYRGW